MRTRTCPSCGFTTSHPRDIKERYCARCGSYSRTPWTLQELWDSLELPDKAFERLWEGCVWSEYEPTPPLLLSPPTSKDYGGTIRVADFKGGILTSRMGVPIFGQWRGDKEWLQVGYINKY